MTLLRRSTLGQTNGSAGYVRLPLRSVLEKTMNQAETEKDNIRHSTQKASGRATRGHKAPAGHVEDLTSNVTVRTTR